MPIELRSRVRNLFIAVSDFERPCRCECERTLSIILMQTNFRMQNTRTVFTESGLNRKRLMKKCICFVMSALGLGSR